MCGGDVCYMCCVLEVICEHMTSQAGTVALME